MEDESSPEIGTPRLQQVPVQLQHVHQLLVSDEKRPTQHQPLRREEEVTDRDLGKTPLEVDCETSELVPRVFLVQLRLLVQEVLVTKG